MDHARGKALSVLLFGYDWSVSCRNDDSQFAALRFPKSSCQRGNPGLPLNQWKRASFSQQSATFRASRQMSLVATTTHPAAAYWLCGKNGELIDTQ
jgi:hypothetical protein